MGRPFDSLARSASADAGQAYNEIEFDEHDLACLCQKGQRLIAQTVASSFGLEFGKFWLSWLPIRCTLANLDVLCPTGFGYE